MILSVNEQSRCEGDSRLQGKRFTRDWRYCLNGLQLVIFSSEVWDQYFQISEGVVSLSKSCKICNLHSPEYNVMFFTYILDVGIGSIQVKTNCQVERFCYACGRELRFECNTVALSSHRNFVLSMYCLYISMCMNVLCNDNLHFCSESGTEYRTSSLHKL